MNESKKVWSAPKISDLDSNLSAGGPNPDFSEGGHVIGSGAGASLTFGVLGSK